MEMQPAELAIVVRLLADLPHREDPLDAAARLAAAASELIYQRGYVDRMGEMVVEGELRAGSHEEELLFGRIAAALTELIRHVERHFGPFPAERWRHGGVRETYLVEIAPERRQDARWTVEAAHRSGDAPAPVEPVGRMVLRAVGDDLAEVERFLGELAAGASEEASRELALELAAGCGELALLIAATLPPQPSDEAASCDAGARGAR